jgi:hypothetical protein
VGSLATFDALGAASTLAGVAHGDIVFFNGAIWTRLAPGTAGQVLQTQGVGADPIWAAAASGGITPAQHKALRDLIHFIDNGPADGFASGSVRELTYTSGLVTRVVWWTDATKTLKIVQTDVTYTGALSTAEVWQMFDTDGVTVLVTLTDSIIYSGALETERTRTWV